MFSIRRRPQVKTLMWVLVVAVAAALVVPATAGAVTFGAANLESRTANNTITCGTVLATSCTSYASSEMPPVNAAESLAVPLPDPVANGDQTGRIDAVRIKAAPGPAAQAQLAIVELSQPATGGEVFPSDVSALSATFTLNPGLNTIATNLPVSYRLASSGFVVRSALAITILNSTTPIPGEFRSFCSSIFTKSVNPGSAFPPYQGLLEIGDLTTGFVQNNGLCNFQVLMQADMTITTPPRGDAGPPPVTPTVPTKPLLTPPPPKTPVLDFGRGVATVRGPVAILPLSCGADVACVGTLALHSARALAASARSPRKPIIYGRSKIKLGAGKTRRIKVKLSKTGRALIRKRRRAKVYATVTYRSGKTASHRITLKRAPR
jgi:hypothetical protein